MDQIKNDIIGPTDLSVVLRKVKVLAYQLNSPELKEWIEHELNGYGSEDPLPDYRILDTVSRGSFVNIAWKANDVPIPMANLPRELHSLDNVELRQGIGELESLLDTLKKTKGDSLTLPWPASLLPYLNNRVMANMNCMGAWRIVTKAQITGIIENTRNRLLTFVLELGERFPIQAKEDFELSGNRVPQDQIRQVVNNYIMGNATTVHTSGGNMATFDQRNQKVTYQYNAAGDINLEHVTNRAELTGELKKLRAELDRARDAEAIDAEVVTEVEYRIAKAIHESEKPNPDKKAMLDYVGGAKGLLMGTGAVAGLVSALAKVAELIGALF